MAIPTKAFKLANDAGRTKLRNIGAGANHYYRPETSVYICGDADGSNYATINAAMDLDEAIAFRDHLSAVIEDIKANLPKVPTNVERIKAFPVGTRFTVRTDESGNEPAEWVRTFRGISGQMEDHVSVNADFLEFWNTLIVEKIEEEN